MPRSMLGGVVGTTCEGALGTTTCNGAVGTTCEGALGTTTRNGAVGTTWAGAAGKTRDDVAGVGSEGLTACRSPGGGMACTSRGRARLSFTTRPRWFSPVGTRGVSPKSLTPVPGTQMNWAELPRGSGAPAGRLHDWQTNRPWSKIRYARGLDAPGGTDPGSIQFSAARFVVATTEADVTFTSPSPGSERRARATS